MLKKTEMIEGHIAFQRFRDATRAVLAVPHLELKRRIDAHRELASRNPKKRGPKRKD